MSKVFVNGVFDILHPGHLELLKFAKSKGSVLMVAIDSDKRAAANKRIPIYNERARKSMLEAVKYVDRVRIFDSDGELTDIVSNYQPDIMVVGEEYKNKKVIGSEYAKELLFFPRIPEFATSKTIEDIVTRRDVRR